MFVSKGTFIYYVSTFIINSNILRNFLSIFLFLYVLNISNYKMKISSECNVEKEILLCWQKTSFCDKLRSQNKFCAIKCLRNIWMVPNMAYGKVFRWRNYLAIVTRIHIWNNVGISLSLKYCIDILVFCNENMRIFRCIIEMREYKIGNLK